MGGWRRPVFAGLAALSSLVLVLVVVGPIAWWVGGHTVTTLQGKERADAINAVRQTLLAAVTGLAALSALVFTGRSYYLNRRGQLTDRYAKAVSLLASQQMTERIGGVFALEHLMNESSADHDTVVQVLAAFARERCPAGGAPPEPRPDADPASGSRQPVVRCPADVQAALTVLGRRPQRPERPIDLSHADLSGADLTLARLPGARFQGSVLAHAQLTGAELTDADFSDAVLTDALLTRAVLRDATLVRANLRNAILAAADLSSTRLMNADLRFAGLPHADLTGAHMLETRLEGAELVRAQLIGAYLVKAVFDHAVLYGARLCHADLRGARFDAADLRHADFTNASLTGITVGALTRTELEDVLWRQLDTNGQVLGELFDTLDEADPEHANLCGVKVSPGDEHRFPALPPAPPLPAETPGYVIGRDQQP